MASDLQLPGPVVDQSWLRAHLGHPDLVVADVRWRMAEPGGGRAAYDGAHIPGAVFVDLDNDLASAPSMDGRGGRHPLPASGSFAAVMAGKGIGDDHVVVAYDDAGGSVASRLWWMLDTLGHSSAVLDGGIGAWSGPTESDAPERPVATFGEKPWPAKAVADADAVAQALADGVAVVDARGPERFSGESEPIDARAGHIPGARNLPWAGNLGDQGRFKPEDELRTRFSALAEGGEPPIVYCGSGVTACHDLLAMRLAGIDDARLYVGSWSDWSSDGERPVATKEETS
jgi:thiosulfate/3-mercaptopyruvate sulfurtransferase